MKRTGLVAVLFVAAIATIVLARYRSAPRGDATVSYYFIPGCSTCARTMAQLEQVVAPYHEHVVLRLVENTSDEGVAAAKRTGFISHGLVLEDRAGKVQLVESDHRVYPEHVAAALERILPGFVPPP